MSARGSVIWERTGGLLFVDATPVELGKAFGRRYIVLVTGDAQCVLPTSEIVFIKSVLGFDGPLPTAKTKIWTVEW